MKEDSPSWSDMWTSKKPGHGKRQKDAQNHCAAFALQAVNAAASCASPACTRDL